MIDITIIGKPTPAGIAFVKYTLSPRAWPSTRQGGFTLLTPDGVRAYQAVPAAIMSELGS